MSETPDGTPCPKCFGTDTHACVFDREHAIDGRIVEVDQYGAICGDCGHTWSTWEQTQAAMARAEAMR